MKGFGKEIELLNAELKLRADQNAKQHIKVTQAETTLQIKDYEIAQAQRDICHLETQVF